MHSSALFYKRPSIAQNENHDTKQTLEMTNARLQYCNGNYSTLLASGVLNTDKVNKNLPHYVAQFLHDQDPWAVIGNGMPYADYIITSDISDKQNFFRTVTASRNISDSYVSGHSGCTLYFANTVESLEKIHAELLARVTKIQNRVPPVILIVSDPHSPLLDQAILNAFSIPILHVCYIPVIEFGQFGVNATSLKNIIQYHIAPLYFKLAILYGIVRQDIADAQFEYLLCNYVKPQHDEANLVTVIGDLLLKNNITLAVDNMTNTLMQFGHHSKELPKEKIDVIPSTKEKNICCALL